MKVLLKTSLFIAKACFCIACLSLVLMAFHMFADVSLRRMGVYIEGTLEFTSYYYMIFAVFLGLSYTQYKDNHISTDIIINLLSQGKRLFLMRVNLIVQLCLYGLLTYQTLFDAIDSASFNEEAMANFTFYIWPAKIALPLGFFSLFLIVLTQLFTCKSSSHHG